MQNTRIYISRCDHPNR